MSVNVKCKCGAVLQISEEHIGQRAQCPQCNKVFVIPEALRAKLEAAKQGQAQQPPSAPVSSNAEPSKKPPFDKSKLKWIAIAAVGVVVVAVAVAALMVFGIIGGEGESVPDSEEPSDRVTRLGPTESDQAPAPARVEFGEFSSPANECARRLRTIYAALTKYREERGAYPPDLASLTPDYIARDKVSGLCCPLGEGNGNLDDFYVYSGPVIASLPRFHMLIWDRDNIHEGELRAALFSDGHTRLLGEDEFASLLLERHDGIMATPGEVALLNSLRPQLRIANRRFAELVVKAGGETLGVAPYGEHVDFPLKEGPAEITFALEGRETEPLMLTLSGGIIHSITFPPNSELPAINIRLMNYFSTPSSARRTLSRPEGPDYSPITAEENRQQRLLGLRSDSETLTFISPVVIDQAASTQRIDLNNGLIYGEIERSDRVITGLPGQPIKVNDIQRIAEGLEIRDDGTRITYLSTSIGTVIYDLKPNLSLAEAAMLKEVNGRSPWAAHQPDDMMMEQYHGGDPEGQEPAPRKPMVELPDSFDVEPASFVEFVDYDAMAPHIRKLGRPVVNELIQRYVGRDEVNQTTQRRTAPPRRPAPPAFRQPERQEAKPTPPLWLSGDMGYDGMREPGMGGGGLLGPQTVRDDGRDMGMYDDPVMYDDMRRQQEEVELSERDRLAQALGFFLTPREMSVLLEQPQRQQARRMPARRAGRDNPFVILALGRIGSPLAIHTITGWDDWRGGPPKKQPEKPASRDDMPPDMPQDMPPDIHDDMMYDDPEMSGMRETATMNIPAVVALSMIDSPLNETGIMRLGWFHRLEDKAISVGLDYPGRAALARMLTNWNAEQLAMAMRAWPDMADWWPRQNFLKALAQSENRNLDNPGLLAEAYRFEPAAAATLARTLLDKNNNVAAAQMLCRMGDVDTIERMLALAQSNNAREAYTAAMALAAVGDPAMLEPVKTAVERVLQAGDGEHRANVMKRWADVNIRLEEDLEPIAELVSNQLNAGDDQVRTAAVNTLVMLAPSLGINILAPALESNHKATRIAALEALAMFGENTDAATPAIFADAISDIVEGLDYTGRQMLSELVLAALEADDQDIMIAAIEAAGSMRIQAAAEKLAGLLDEHGGNEEAEELLVASARALGRIGDDSIAPQLLIALRDPSYKVRMAVAEALGEMGSPAAVSELSRALADENADVRIAAVDALGKINHNRAYEALVRIAFPPELQYSNVSWPALKSLVKANQPAAYEALKGRIGESDVWVMWSVVNAACNELAPEERDQCVRFLSDYLDSEHVWLRVLAAHGMAELERPELARELLIEKNPNPYGMVAPMARIFGAAGNREDVAALTRMYANYERFRGAPPGASRDLMDDGYMHQEMPGIEQPVEQQPQQPEVAQRIDPRLVIFEAVGRIGGNQAVQFLGRQFDHRMPEEPMGYIIRALGDSEAEDAVSHLISIGRRVESLETRIMVIEALAKVAHLDRGNSERLLNDARRSDRTDISAAAADALDKMRRNLALAG